MTHYDVTITIKGIETLAPEYYLHALICHIKTLVEQELNGAPDAVVMSYDKTEIEGKVIQ